MSVIMTVQEAELLILEVRSYSLQFYNTFLWLVSSVVTWNSGEEKVNYSGSVKS